MTQTPTSPADRLLKRIRSLIDDDVIVTLTNDEAGHFEARFERNVEGSFNISIRKAGESKFNKRGHLDLDQIAEFLTLNTIVEPTVDNLLFKFVDADTLETDIPLLPELPTEDIEDYEASLIAQAKALIVEREATWDSDKPACYRAIKELTCFTGNTIFKAEAELRAEKAAAFATA